MIWHVVAFTVRPGMAGEIAQDAIVPVVVGVCVAGTAAVSTTAAGVKTIVGFAITTARFKVAEAVPVVFVTVIV